MSVFVLICKCDNPVIFGCQTLCRWCCCVNCVICVLVDGKWRIETSMNSHLYFLFIYLVICFVSSIFSFGIWPKVDNKKGKKEKKYKRNLSILKIVRLFGCLINIMMYSYKLFDLVTERWALSRPIHRVFFCGTIGRYCLLLIEWIPQHDLNQITNNEFINIILLWSLLFRSNN